MAAIRTTCLACASKKTSGTTFGCCSAATRISGTTTCSQIRLNPASLNPPGSLTTGCYVGPPTAAFPQGAPAILLEPRRGAKQFAACAGSCAPHAGLRSHAASAIRRCASDWAIPVTATRGPASSPRTAERYRTFNRELQLHDECLSRWRRLPHPAAHDNFLRPVPQLFQAGQRVTRQPGRNPAEFRIRPRNLPGQGTPNGTPVDLGNIWSTQTPAEAFPAPLRS